MLIGLHHGFGVDETIYLSQINAHAPAAMFTAPRARGMTLIVAPMTLWTDNVPAIRLWLTALTGVGMFVAFRPWLRIVDGPVVPLAALLFSSLWVVIYYGFEAMPNIYVALAAVALLGCFFRFRAEQRLRWSVGAAACFAAAALIRPSDALYMLVPLLVTTAVIGGLDRRHRGLLAVALVGGFAAGAAEWVVEAYVRFGGLLERIHLAQAQQGPGGLHFSLPAQAHALAGPLLCRGSCTASSPVWSMIWWFLVPLLVAVGIGVSRRRSPLVVATVTAVALAAEYVVTIGYAAPRFLTPTYALLSLPVAVGLVSAGRAARTQWRPVAVTAVTALVGVQAVSQAHILRADVLPSPDVKISREQDLAAALRTDFRLSGRCEIAGDLASPIAFRDRCSSYPRLPTEVDDAADRRGTEVVWLSHGPRLPAALTGWQEVRLRRPGLQGRWYAATDPAAGQVNGSHGRPVAEAPPRPRRDMWG